MLIPYQDLDADTLHNLIEYFILREGTDYGEQEISLPEKSTKVLEQLKEGSVVILYSELSESVTLIHRDQLKAQQHNLTDH
ncbi:YheU family protein [Psychromonas ossibalaenae]|uniref:YheU family protein n=1 Tax=Psychromonas ossibalaenae TaxID=444922 RepID=UPI00037E3AC3|nr:YheU family protein [Psychromonas ossibalaenae]